MKIDQKIRYNKNISAFASQNLLRIDSLNTRRILCKTIPHVKQKQIHNNSL